MQAGQQAAAYPEVADSLATTKSYAEQAKAEAERAAAQKALVAKAEADAQGPQKP